MNNNDSSVTISDEKIIDLYFSRNENAITETEKKYGRYLISIAFNILKNDQDSEECVNDAYLNTWRSIPPNRPVSLRAYIARLTRNAAINRYDSLRSAGRVPLEACEPFEELENMIAYSRTVEDDEISDLIEGIVSQYLSGVNDRRLYIFVARYFYIRDIESIATRLGVSRSTVNKELAKMRSELREILLKGGINV